MCFCPRSLSERDDTSDEFEPKDKIEELEDADVKKVADMIEDTDVKKVADMIEAADVQGCR